MQFLMSFMISFIFDLTLKFKLILFTINKEEIITVTFSFYTLISVRPLLEGGP